MILFDYTFAVENDFCMEKELNNLQPESLMMSHGYKPSLSEGAIKAPIFQTSTFVFDSAEAGKNHFALAYGLRKKTEGEELGLIYSRINNPNLEILENRLCLWDKAEDCAVFESGMSAISTVLLQFLKPGDLLLFSSPIYGGTDHFINHFLPQLGVEAVCFTHSDSKETIISKVEETGKADKLSMVYLETPANPTNALIDISLMREIADHFSVNESAEVSKRIPVAVDNTYMGPLWSHPLEHGADLVIYSATKYIGGHSDLIAGAVLGDAGIVSGIRVLRTFLGNMPSPHTCWLLLRSLETLKVRMEQQARNAKMVADFLMHHPKVERMYYLGQLKEGDKDFNTYKNQYNSAGAMLAFDIKGGEEEAFQFLNGLQLIKLAVSLGSTESLAQHPDTMTHAGVCPDLKSQMGITCQMVRLSIGVENGKDLIWDIEQAFNKVVLDQTQKNDNKYHAELLQQFESI